MDSIKAPTTKPLPNNMSTRILSYLSTMEGTTTKKAQLTYLGQDILLKIFTKSDPKTVGKCRCLNKTWNGRLSTPMFAKQNWFENKDNNRNVILELVFHLWKKIPYGLQEPMSIVLSRSL
ncbi:hypothetical protein Ahy_B04g073458 [Arachis hypogaea]|uniref:F-box domain-containing protein n=1 Tax=Arachis hypogaea TaxID=3818 RepID=A0A444ZQH2_ARAHY|nr:hypothetical protein Ahy_B04g073458 [Arachis hypogaea]